MMNFPDSPVAGQKATVGGRRYQYVGGVWVSDDSVARPRQRLVNPSMRIMQEYQLISTGALATGDYYAADQWQVVWSTGSALINSTLLAPDPTYPSYPSQTIQLATTAGYATVGASEHLQIRQWLEDRQIADLINFWGTANAKGFILRFWVWCTYAGTYSLKVSNGNYTRSYVTPIYYPNAATWQQFTISIPGDTGGTWPLPTQSAGMLIAFVPRIGTTYQTALVNSWIDGDLYGVIGSNNFTALGASTFRLSQVEMYLDPYGSGIAPRYVMRPDSEELRLCQRYWYRAYSLRGECNGATTLWGANSRNPVTMRDAPTVSIRGTVGLYDGAATANATSVTNWSGFEGVEVILNCAGGLHVGYPGMQYVTGVDDYLAVTARM